MAGHSTITMTANTLAHVMLNLQRAAADRLGAILPGRPRYSSSYRALASTKSDGCRQPRLVGERAFKAEQHVPASPLSDGLKRSDVGYWEPLYEA